MQSNKEKKWFIGIDGGGTKTRAAICDETGHVLAVVEGGASNPLSRPWSEVEHTLGACISSVCEQGRVCPADVDGLYIGLGGADRPRVKAMIETAFADSWQERLSIDNDAVAALYAGTWGSPGIVLISGTGSIAYAVTKQGTRHRVGGWGYLVGDEGSGFDLGRKAAIAVLRAHDGRGQETLLTDLFLAHYGVERPDELISLLYESSNPRMDLAQTSALVERAAVLGDPIATELIRQAADALIELARTCLAKGNEPLPVVLAGGLLTAETSLRRQFLEKAPFATVIPTVSPVIGSLVAAMTHSGCHVNEAVIRKLRASGNEREEIQKVRETGVRPVGENLYQLHTEMRNAASERLDQMSALEIVTLMNQEDQKVALAVQQVLPEVAKAVELIGSALEAGGRLFYFGAGTSGRLGVLDAAECPPTFGTDPGLVRGIIAGGAPALLEAIEGAEDSQQLGHEDVRRAGVKSGDVIVGIAASGRTPYVIGALEEAKAVQARTISLSCNPDPDISQGVDVSINMVVGPEVVTGSTRLKAGSATKMVLNMLTTASMVHLGKVYGNLMVNVQATNWKLRERAKHIVMQGTGIPYPDAEKLLMDAGGDVRMAIVMHKTGLPLAEAAERLKRAGNRVREAIEGSR